MKVKTQSIILAVVIGLFLLLNIVSSQTVSKLFYEFSAGKKEAAVEFLKRIKDESFFDRYFLEVSGFYQENLEEEVYKEARERQRKIQELEEVLKLNPKARDALYSLYLLYLERGDVETANSYLNQAKEIDPETKN